MDEVKIEIIQLQVTERLFRGGTHVFGTMVRVPELGSDPQVISADRPRLQHSLQAVSYFHFITVITGAIEVSIANFGSVDHDIRSQAFIDLPKPQANGRQFVAGC